MSPVADGYPSSAVNELFNFPESINKLVFPSRSHDSNEARSNTPGIPVDILENPKEYIFFVDVPGLSKTDIQVTVEDQNTLVIRSNGKRKRGDGEEEGCKYIRLERRAPFKFLRKFRLPENSNVAAISAKCDSGVLIVTVEKLPPPPKSKTVQVAIS